MFPDRVQGTPFRNTVADLYFTKITYDNRRGGETDDSFLSTLRAFVYPRMGDNDVLCLRLRNYEESYFIRDGYTDFTVGPNELLVVNLNTYAWEESDFKNVTTLMDSLPYCIAHLTGEWKRIDKVTAFFRKAFNVACYINEEVKSAIVLAENMNLQKFHYLQCGILAYLPWFFDKEEGLSGDDRELIESLRDKSPERYMRVLERMAQPFDFRSLSIKKGLQDFESLYERRKMKSTQENIDECDRQLESLMERYAEVNRMKRDLNITLMGLYNREAGESEVMDYFLCHKNLHFIELNGSYMTFAVTGYVTNFDEDMAEKMIENKRSLLYDVHRHGSYRITTEEMAMLIDEIFIKQNLKLRFCAAYMIDMDAMRMDGMQGFDYASRLGITDCMANPHVDRYACLGDYKRVMNQCLAQQDYIGAIENAIASCNSLNFGDGAVMQQFFERVYGFDGGLGKCIELPDGTIVTPLEAINFLTGQKEGSEDEQAD